MTAQGRGERAHPGAAAHPGAGAQPGAAAHPARRAGAASAARLRCLGMDPQPLAGRTIAVPETRELEVFAAMLERRGASVVRCPLVAIRDAPDPAPVLAFARAFAAGACPDLLLTTPRRLRPPPRCRARHG